MTIEAKKTERNTVSVQVVLDGKLIGFLNVYSNLSALHGTEMAAKIAKSNHVEFKEIGTSNGSDGSDLSI